MSRENREHFESDRAAFLKAIIKKYVSSSPENCLASFADSRIFDEPLVGFADGSDQIFDQYKEIIGDFHLTPREALQNGMPPKTDDINAVEVVSVISFVLPVTLDTRLSLRRETQIPSLRWNHTRWQGQEFINELSRHVVSVLEDLGYLAVAPELADFYKIKTRSDRFGSNWSQRHIAYAAGLGTFSLNDGFITEKGMAMRCGSVVTGAAIPATTRSYKNHLANCLFYSEGSCMRCAERCPAGAITERGHDKGKCLEFLFFKQKEMVKQMGRENGYIGRYLGCGLCQTKVPCEAGIPPRTKAKNKV